MATELNNETIFNSYTTRERRFILDEGSSELGQPNQSEEDYNRAKITQRDLGSLSVIGSLIAVQYGKWEAEDACLIALRFQFQKGNASFFRFEEASIKIEFRARPAGPPDQDPVVLDYGPKMLRSEGTNEEVAWHYLARLSAKATFGPIELGPEGETGKEGKFSRQFATVVESDDWGNSKHRKPNCVKIWMREDKRQKSGVPLELLAAAVVRLSGPAEAIITIKTDTVFHLLARPWSADDPILLQPGVKFGKQIREDVSVDFSTLTQDEWRTLITPDLQLRYVN